jgi:hypothetical protein
MRCRGRSRLPLEGLVQGEQLKVGLGLDDGVKGLPIPIAAALQGMFVSGALDQDAAHGGGRCGEDMRAISVGPAAACGSPCSMAKRM